MSGPVFVDTGGWYALQVPDDRWHSTAAAALRAIVAQGRPLVCSNHVIGETYSLLVRTHGNAAAWRFLETLDRSGRLQRVFVDEDTEREAYQLLQRFGDQSFSFVDGTSFALMRRRRIRQALAFDRHFATAGFLRVGLDTD